MAKTAKKWYIRVRKANGNLVAEGTVSAESAHDAFLRLVRRKRVWPKYAGAWMQHFPGGHTWHVWPAWKVGNGTSLGDLYVARIEEIE